MVEHVQKPGSSGIAKAALITAVGVGGLKLLGLDGGSLLGGSPAQQVAFAAATGGGYVTDKELGLVREIGGKDSEIAQLKAEKYADQAVKAATDPINARVCALETAAAVNAARDRDYRFYVEREFVHQPKARINKSIIPCEPCDCCCGAEGAPVI